MPLWEGFDEPFHYGYVQELSAGRGFPVQGKTPLSGEIWQSVLLAPASDSVKLNIPAVLTFRAYLRLPDAERKALRSRLRDIPGDMPAGAMNYEAQQAPLAYMVLAPADWLLRRVALPDRILALRIVCGTLAVVASTLALFSLANRLSLPPISQSSLVFVVLSSQMFYATTCHVANDWLALPLMILVLDRVVTLDAAPSLWNALAAVLAFSAGLLTKGYFLALTPLILAVAIRRLSTRHIFLSLLAIVLTAGPWYLRNLVLYRDLSGMQQTVGGARLGSLIAAGKHIHWRAATESLIFQTLWTGNNSFRAFSAHTLALLLAGLTAAAALATLGWFRQSFPRAERVVSAGCGLYFAAIAYDLVVVYFASRGEARTSSPWYLEAIAPVLLCLLFRGMARYPRSARAVSIWLTCLSAYVMLVTWWGKLIPLYAGYDDRATPLKLYAWYQGEFSAIEAALASTALGDPRFVLILAAATSAATALLAALLILRRNRVPDRFGPNSVTEVHPLHGAAHRPGGTETQAPLPGCPAHETQRNRPRPSASLSVFPPPP